MSSEFFDLPWYMCKKCKTVRQVPSRKTVNAYHTMMRCRECKKPRRLSDSSRWLKCAAPKEHMVEKIVDYRQVGKTGEFLVKWKDYPSNRNTWEPACNLNPSALKDALDLRERKRAETAAKKKATDLKRLKEWERRNEKGPWKKQRTKPYSAAARGDTARERRKLKRDKHGCLDRCVSVASSTESGLVPETAGKRSTSSISTRSTRNSLATARGVDRSSDSNDDTPAAEVARDLQFARMSGFAAAKKRKRIWTIDSSSTDNDDGDNSDDDDNDDEDYNPLEEESDSSSEADNNADHNNEDDDHNGETPGVDAMDDNAEAATDDMIDDSGDNALSEKERNIVPDWAVKQMVIWRKLVCKDDPRPVFGCDWCGPKIQVGYEGPFSVTSELCPSCEALKSEGFSTATQRHQNIKAFYKDGKAAYYCKKSFLIGTTNTVAKKLGREEKESALEIKSREPASTDMSADKEILPDQRGMCNRHDQEMRKKDENHGNDISSSQTISREGSESSSLSETHSDEASTAFEIVGSSEKEARRKPRAEAETEAGKDMVEEDKPLSVDRDADDGDRSRVWPFVTAAEAYNTVCREKDAVEAILRDVQEEVKRLQSEIEHYKKENNSLKAIRREKDAVEASLRDVKEDLDIQHDTTNQMLVTLGWWHRRFDKVSALAEAAGVDASVLKSIRDGTDGR